MRKFHRGYGYIGGVCDGLGQYFDIDPLLFRLAFTLGSLFTSIFIITYIVIWLFTEEEDYGQPSF